ncbi:hypothetical protein scyTo_0022273 [Scyliorhinus torazame]|uniref:Uncharacterized protein n=1 Tax=Scyliorhinus torazame TaxID=75743 RepID=A0A401Q9M0_SCYTO|nr:hypothetical protein [Scyliorhinus torazame]
MMNDKLGAKECKETNTDEKTPDGEEKEEKAKEEEEEEDDSDLITEALHPDPGDTNSENDCEEEDKEEEEYDVEAHERGQGDVPTFYTYKEGFSHLNPEGQATLQRLEGMLAQSVSQQAFHMAGVGITFSS